jgi:hypothetical protein
MAPIAIEPQKPDAALSLGQYNEQVPGPKAYQKKIELEGTEGHPAAKVRVLLIGPVKFRRLIQAPLIVQALSSDVES